MSDGTPILVFMHICTGIPHGCFISTKFIMIPSTLQITFGFAKYEVSIKYI